MGDFLSIIGMLLEHNRQFFGELGNNIIGQKICVNPYINPRRACAARVTVVVVLCLSHVFCHCAQRGQEAMPTGSALHWLDFKCGDFRKILRSKVMPRKPSE